MEQNQAFGYKGRFQILRLLGSGSYGEVYECIDTLNDNAKVAVKKLIQPKESKKMVGIPQSTIREIGLLREIRHPNVVSLIGIDSDKKGVYLIFEMMEFDLAHYMNRLPTNDPLPRPIIKSVMHQILSALHYLHSRRIFHRDLKPANILLERKNNNQVNIKLADFGLSRTIHQPFRCYSPEILTIWYRAPEMCISEKFTQYSFGVDIWSAGIIFLEMIFCIGKGRYGLLRGQSMIEHLRNQLIVLGSDDILDQLSNGGLDPSQNPILGKILETGNLGSEDEIWLRIFGGESNRERWVNLELEERRKLFWEVVELNIGPDGADLAKKMLRFDQLRRIDCISALSHKFFSKP